MSSFGGEVGVSGGGVGGEGGREGGGGAKAAAESAEEAAAPAAVATAPTKKANMIKLFLRNVNDAPALQKQKFKLDGSKTLFEVEAFLLKNINTARAAPSIKSIFLYCGSGFAPTHEQSLQDLFDCFKTGDELIISYGIQEAWG